MVCKTADKENVFMKRWGLWVTLLLWVRHCSFWSGQEFWQWSTWGPDCAFHSCWWCLKSSLSNGSVVFTVLSKLLILFCEESPGVPHIPMRWHKTVPHFFHGGGHLEAWRLLLLTSAIRIPHSTPADTWKGACHLQAVGNVLLSALWPSYSWV